MATAKKAPASTTPAAARRKTAKPAPAVKPAAAAPSPAKASGKPAADKPVARKPQPTKAAPKKAAADKPKKPKLVRDSFTIPKAEYAALGQLKERAAALARPAKKSELLRAGIKALAALSDADLLGALGAVPTIKTGRPKAA